jgi:tRNA (adenine37-N6)-methyltransferase
MENSKNKWPEMQITPVGLVRSEIKTPMLMAGNSDLELEERMEKIREYHRKVKECVCELVISPQWVELLDGIEGFSHVLVLYWPHLIDPERRKLRKVHPMGRRICRFREFLPRAVRHVLIRFLYRRSVFLNV